MQALPELARAYISLTDTAGARAVLRQAADITQRRPHLGVLPEEAGRLRLQLDTMAGQSIGASALTTAELRLLPLLPMPAARARDERLRRQAQPGPERPAAKQ